MVVSPSDLLPPGRPQSHASRLGKKSEITGYLYGADYNGGDQGKVVVTLFLIASSSRLNSRTRMPPFESLPYRPCAGMTVFNRAGLVSSDGEQTGPNTSILLMCGRCRRAASTKVKIPTRRRCANCTRKPISALCRNWRNSGWLTYDLPSDVDSASAGRASGAACERTRPPSGRDGDTASPTPAVGAGRGLSARPRSTASTYSEPETRCGVSAAVLCHPESPGAGRGRSPDREPRSGPGVPSPG